MNLYDFFSNNKKTNIVENIPSAKDIEGEYINENLRKWFKEKWVRFGPDGKIRGECARGDDSEGKPKCLPQAKAHALGKKGRKYAASKKRREDPNPERSGSAINVATKKKTNEDMSEMKCPHCNGPMFSESLMMEKKDACYYKVKSRYKVWPSAYASGALVKCRKKGAKNWGKTSESNESISEQVGPRGETIRIPTSPGSDAAWDRSVSDLPKVSGSSGHVPMGKPSGRNQDVWVPRGSSALTYPTSTGGKVRQATQAEKTAWEKDKANWAPVPPEPTTTSDSRISRLMRGEKISDIFMSPEEKELKQRRLASYAAADAGRLPTTPPLGASTITKPQTASGVVKPAPTSPVQTSTSTAAAVPSNKTSWQQIYNINRSTIGSNPNLIKPGQQLKLPDGSTYTVARGDNLSNIARGIFRGSRSVNENTQKLYFNVIGTDKKTLINEFGFSKNNKGWHLSENAAIKNKLDAMRAFGMPLTEEEMNQIAYDGTASTIGTDNPRSPVGSIPKSQRINSKQRGKK
jgi:hypothetical protein